MNLKSLSGGSKSGFAYSAFIILYFLFSLLIQTIAGLALPTDGVFYRVVCSLIVPISSIILTAVYGASEKRNILKVGGVTKFNPMYLIPAVLLAFGMLFGFGFINLAFNQLMKNVGLSVSVPSVPMSNGWEFALMIISIGFLPAVFEELIFRGVMRENLNGVKTPVAILFIGLAFAIFHASLAQLIYQFIYGCFLAWLAIKADSAIPAMLAHFINNLIILFFEYLGVAVNFYNGLIIAGGIIAVLGVAAFLFFYKREKQEKPENKKNIAGFAVFSSVGVLIMLIWIIAGVL